MTNTFIDDLEEVVEAAAQWAVEQVDIIVDVLAPDGRAFGTKKLTPEEKIAQYLQLRGNATAWAAWVDDRASTIVQELLMGGVSAEDIQAIKPLDIATAFAIQYSASMEKLIKEQTNGAS